ncbi:ABC-2 type transport system permease protein [Thermocatellispora tengchongensis]|uniref:ABC-2 type transport system permease protein n=1 Tax=Thermocatellispora tengchongensis TaxID=1073253 RepID=A0A840PPS4_9ACTN|nr:ABC transporter permease [Thermocatellispora tengchongensis]MBB5138015.1 ABC-2 type transport system permease protein [Thermocatellispora tengchongensis]
MTGALPYRPDDQRSGPQGRLLQSAPPPASSTSSVRTSRLAWLRADALHAIRLARIDLTLLGRNQTALFNVLLLPLLVGWLFTATGAPRGRIEGVPAEIYVLTGLPALMLGFAVFVNLVNTFTARREELVLKRLRGGQASPAAILGGSALGALAVFLGQIALLALWITRVEDGPLPANIPLLLVGALLGVAVFALLAAAFSGLTPNAELAQIAVLPVLLVILLAAPLFGPLEALPEPLRVAASVLPVTPVLDIMRTAYLGGGKDLADQWLSSLPSMGLLLAWIALAALAARFLFRWDPRRG